MSKDNKDEKKMLKIHSSIVGKIGIQTFSRILTLTIMTNILFIIFFCFFIFIKIEYNVKNDHVIHTAFVDKIPNESEFFKVISDVYKNEKILSRNISIPDHGNLYYKLTNAKYDLYLNNPKNEKKFILYSYDLGFDIKIFLNFFLVLLVIEIINLIKGVMKSERKTKEALRPIAQMAEAAKSLNELSKGIKLSDLEGVISSIDENKLDKGIDVSSVQNELKGLANAINGMLSRINDAYLSQIRFVSDASHELRTPISVIQGYVNLLDRWGKNDEKTMQEAIDAIKIESENMKELIEQLLFLARGDSQTIQFNLERFDVFTLLNEVVSETNMIDKNHIIKSELKEGCFVMADRQLLKQAIRIFVDNSIKYTPKMDYIFIKSYIDKYVKIVISDNGVGIAEYDLENIFNRFYRSEISRARKYGGTGLGLSIAKWIIDSHQGYVEVVSRVGIGTKITLNLPLSQE